AILNVQQEPWIGRQQRRKKQRAYRLRAQRMPFGRGENGERVAVHVDVIGVRGFAAAVANRTARYETVARRRRGAGPQNGITLGVRERLTAADERRALQRGAHFPRRLGNPR